MANLKTLVCVLFREKIMVWEENWGVFVVVRGGHRSMKSPAAAGIAAAGDGIEGPGRQPHGTNADDRKAGVSGACGCPVWASGAPSPPVLGPNVTADCPLKRGRRTKSDKRLVWLPNETADCDLEVNASQVRERAAQV